MLCLNFLHILFLVKSILNRSLSFALLRLALVWSSSLVSFTIHFYIGGHWWTNPFTNKHCFLIHLKCVITWFLWFDCLCLISIRSRLSLRPFVFTTFFFQFPLHLFHSFSSSSLSSLLIPLASCTLLLLRLFSALLKNGHFSHWNKL